jgi:hypothetical protein
MHHHLTVDTNDFKNYQNCKRHIIVKDSSPYEISDSLFLTEEGTRNQIEFVIADVEVAYINKKRMLLTLYAPYGVHIDPAVPFTIEDLPATVG